MRRVVELALFTEQVEAMTDFYRKVIGMEPAYANAHMALFQMDHLTLLIHRKGDQQPGMPPNSDHFALSAQSLDKTVQSLQEGGIDFECEPRSYDWGRSAYFRDPDGRLLELQEKE